MFEEWLPIQATEDCPRCHGLLVLEDFYAEHQKIPQVRCVNCGWIYQRPTEEDNGIRLRIRRRAISHKSKKGFWA